MPASNFERIPAEAPCAKHKRSCRVFSHGVYSTARTDGLTVTMGKDRYYYRADGTYRGKSSDSGPIAQALGAMLMLGLAGFFFLSMLVKYWWEVSLSLVLFASVITILPMFLYPFLTIDNRRRRLFRRFLIAFAVEATILTALLFCRYSAAQIVDFTLRLWNAWAH